MNAIKERGILFSAPMVRALLDGRKTVTRRAVKGMALDWLADFEPSYVADPENGMCPYGKPGERLWVREAWAADAQLNAVAPRDLSRGEPILYPADGFTRTSGCSMISQGRGRPSIHMPRWVSRILLEITDVRVERLQDISEEQSEAEGVGFLRAAPDFDETLTAKQLYEILWDHINGAGAWDGNPWVWVVEFKQVMPAD